MQKTKMSLADFKQFTELPENSDRLFELIDGEVVEVSPGRARNSEFHSLITGEVYVFCREHDLPCHITNADGAFLVGGNVVAPDFAYKRTPMSKDYPDPDPPLWVVEVISPTDKAKEIRNKRQIYINAGILLWELYPDTPSVDVYAPGQPLRTFGIDDMLDVGDLLPGFTLSLRELFEE